MSERPIHPVQAMVDGWSAAWQRQRAHTQLTLGALITALSELEPDRRIAGLGELSSYRGYYCDLAFEPERDRSVAEVLATCRSAMGRTFEGYKGGEFLMGESTPLWLSPWGDATGMRLMGLDTSTDPIQPITQHEDE